MGERPLEVEEEAGQSHVQQQLGSRDGRGWGHAGTDAAQGLARWVESPTDSSRYHLWSSLRAAGKSRSLILGEATLQLPPSPGQVPGSVW